MKNIIWIDVGTHFGQEYKSVFGSKKYFYWKIFRRFIGSQIMGMGKFIKLNELITFAKLRSKINKKRKNFHVIFIEANPRIIVCRKIYSEADSVFNIALIEDKNNICSLKRLFFKNNDELSQGSSIYEKKDYASDISYITVLGVSPSLFFAELKNDLDKIKDNYNVMLRLNCEGAEDDVIYAADKIFNKNLKLVAGSLKDVNEIKGEEAYNRLMNFLESRQIKNVFFSSSVISWKNAHNAVLDLLY